MEKDNLSIRVIGLTLLSSFLSLKWYMEPYIATYSFDSLMKFFEPILLSYRKTILKKGFLFDRTNALYQLFHLFWAGVGKLLLNLKMQLFSQFYLICRHLYLVQLLNEHWNYFQKKLRFIVLPVVFLFRYKKIIVS